MKKLFVFLFSLILSVVFSTSASAYDVKIDGIYYNLNSEGKTAEVTKNVEDKYSGDVVIPSSITVEEQEYTVTSIGESAFSLCSGLTSITIPNSVTSIGRYAFNSCSGLTTVTIPNSVTSIGDFAFYQCKGLTSVTIPNSVTSIGRYAFSDCWDLTSVTIPNSVTSIGDFAFEFCNRLEDIIIVNNMFVHFPETYSGHYSIPENISQIIGGAFAHCSGLTSITIPNSVTSIGNSAFSRCTGLTSITIPNSVTSIGESAFMYCNRLEDIIIVNNMFVHFPETYSGHYSIPENISQIIGGAFAHCKGLTSVDIPNSVTSIGDYAFRRCSGLTTVTIPNSVTSIGDYAFYDCSGLTTVTIPNSVTSIGQSAFRNCSGLTSITIPNSVTSISREAFSRCTGLTTVTIPNSVTSIGKGAFYACSGLTTVTIPNSVTSIGESAFNNCKGLTSVDIPNSVESISYSAFRSCSGLTSITIPNSVTSIGETAFSNCSKLENVYCYAENIPSTDGTAFKNSSIASSTLHVPGSALSSYQATVPWSGFGTILPIEPLDITVDTDTKEATVETAKFVEDGNVVIPASIEVDGETYTVTSIANEAFKDVEDVETVTLPRTLKEIGKGAFSGCKALKEVVVSETATNRKVSAVRYGKIQRVATRAAGDGMRIGERAFADCPVLASVTIPSTATTIGDNVFNNCESLKNVTCEAVNCPTVKTFGEFPISEATLTVPVGSLKQYGETNPWSLFGKIQDFDGTTGVNGISVYDCNDVKDVYGIDGSKRPTPAKGLNIIRMSDGTTRKVMR